MALRPLSVPEVEHIAFELAKRFLAWDEPIPEFSTRTPNALERCLAAPFAGFGGRYLYRGLVGKAAILFYLLVKNHPFLNGNKRIAITTLLVFLGSNGKWLRVDTHEFYEFAKWIAMSNPRLKDESVLAVQKFLKTYMVNRDAT